MEFGVVDVAQGRDDYLFGECYRFYDYVSLPATGNNTNQTAWAIKDSSSVGVYSDPLLVLRPVSLNKYKFCFALEQRT